MTPSELHALEAVLGEARDLGFLGPGPLSVHLDQARAFATALGEAPQGGGVAVDLGSGGGVPGLPLAVAGNGWSWTLLEGSASRARFLERAVARLGLTVTVLAARAEEVGRDPTWRGRALAATARSFGPPAVVAECAAPLLAVGGRLVVSEPPPGDGVDGEGRVHARWPESVRREVGLGPPEAVRHGGFGFVRLTQVAPCPPRYPRRVGVPARRPLT